ncbi:MAG: hypothetical protein ACE5KZ_08940 [Candidatus Scalinduaceae bacterium]
MKEEKDKRENATIWGIASNNEDNHKRITKGENFYLYGGSEDNHNNMIESVLEFNALITKYGKRLEDITESEYFEIVSKIKRKNINWHYFLNHFKK